MAGLLPEIFTPAMAAGADAGWDAPEAPARRSGYWGEFLDGLRDDMVAKASKSQGELLRDAPVVGHPLKFYDAYEAKDPWGMAGQGAMIGLDLLPWTRQLGTATGAMAKQIQGLAAMHSGAGNAAPRAIGELARDTEAAQAAYPAELQRRIDLARQLGERERGARGPRGGQGRLLPRGSAAENAAREARVGAAFPPPATPQAIVSEAVSSGRPIADVLRAHSALIEEPGNLAKALMGTALVGGVPAGYAAGKAAADAGDRIHTAVENAAAEREAEEAAAGDERIRAKAESNAPWYEAREASNRKASHWMAGGSAALGAATVPLAYYGMKGMAEHGSPFMVLAGDMLDSPALIALGAAPMVPAGLTGFGSYALGKGAAEAHRRADSLSHLLESNYRHGNAPISAIDTTAY